MNGHDRRSIWCEQLYEERAAALILYGRALGLTHAEAEDVLQDTFVALMELEAPPEHPERFVIRAYRNRAINHRRSLLRRLKRETAAIHWFEQPDTPSEVEARAIQALANLPAKQREVVVLKIWHDLTFETIGAVTGVSPNTVAARYRHALRKVREAVSNAISEAEHEQSALFGTMASLIETSRSVPGT